MYIGTHNKDPAISKKLKISDLIIHPLYDKVMIKHDIALLKLAVIEAKKTCRLKYYDNSIFFSRKSY